MTMFCFQCQEAAGGRGCTIRGVCGKNEQVAKLQDLLIYTLKGISDVVVKGKINSDELDSVNYEMLNSLFMTITNANFDDGAIEKQIKKMISIRDELREKAAVVDLHDAATFQVSSKELIKRYDALVVYVKFSTSFVFSGEIMLPLKNSAELWVIEPAVL
jgi:hydroxylamine reductase